MRITVLSLGIPAVWAAAVALYLVLSGMAWAHCDTTGGPIIPEARAALEKGDVTPILKWIGKTDEEEIKSAFARAVVVRGKGPEARDLADHYFLETLIRLHRAGEGAPYTGIRDEPAEPIAAMADKALAEGKCDGMIGELKGHMEKAVREKFDRAATAAGTRDRSVEEGREYVEAYVTYVHYVEGIHDAIASAGGHQHAGAPEPAPAAPYGHKE